MNLLTNLHLKPHEYHMIYFIIDLIHIISVWNLLGQNTDRSLATGYMLSLWDRELCV